MSLRDAVLKELRILSQSEWPPLDKYAMAEHIVDVVSYNVAHNYGFENIADTGTLREAAAKIVLTEISNYFDLSDRD